MHRGPTPGDCHLSGLWLTLKGPHPILWLVDVQESVYAGDLAEEEGEDPGPAPAAARPSKRLKAPPKVCAWVCTGGVVGEQPHAAPETRTHPHTL
jgi:hypothetical protein